MTKGSFLCFISYSTCKLIFCLLTQWEKRYDLHAILLERIGGGGRGERTEVDVHVSRPVEEIAGTRVNCGCKVERLSKLKGI